MLYLVANYRDTEVVFKLLEYKPDVNALDNNSMTALH